ncbi:hypothetical protein ACT3TB_19285, partial [Micrococcaceae sp. AOP34-BR2-30]
VKSPKSLARKISADRAREARRGEKLTSMQAASKVRDVVRYTIVKQEHDDLAGTVAEAVSQLQAHGWKVSRIKNFYREGAPYKGLHIICESPTGDSTELQIHSTQSLAAKEAAHLHYETYRDRAKSIEERSKAKAVCEDIYAGVSTPPGLDAVEAAGLENTEKVTSEKQV